MSCDGHSAKCVSDELISWVYLAYSKGLLCYTLVLLIILLNFLFFSFCLHSVISQ